MTPAALTTQEGPAPPACDSQRTLRTFGTNLVTILVPDCKLARVVLASPGASPAVVSQRAWRALVRPLRADVVFSDVRSEPHSLVTSRTDESLPPAGDELVDILRTRILRGIDAGALRAGDRLPSARDWGAELGVDHRAVLAAARELAREGLVETRERGGVYVSSLHGTSGIPPLPEPWIVELLSQGLAREIPGPELGEWLRRCTETLRLRAAVITSTTDQALGLCRELRDDFGVEAECVTMSELPEAAAGADSAASFPLPLRRADLIIATQSHATRARALGEMLHKEVIVTDVRPDLVTGEWALLLRRPVYAVVATAQFGEMIRRFFAGVPGIENLHVLVFGEDDVSSIPAGAPTYVTQGVRARLGGVEIPGRILAAARTIAPASAREIFGFIVRSNLEALRRLAR